MSWESDLSDQCRPGHVFLLAPQGWTDLHWSPKEHCAHLLRLRAKFFHLSFMEACVLPPALVYRCEITECTHQLMNRLANLERIFFLPASSELLTVQIWVALSNPCEAAWAFLQNAVIPDLQVIATEPFSSPAVNDFPPASPSPRKCINLH